MREKIRDIYDAFELDEETRKKALDNILAQTGASQAESERTAGRVRHRKGRIIAAACAVIALSFGTAAFASGWFGLKDLSTGRTDEEMTVVFDGVESTEKYKKEAIALSGVKGSPEYQAAAEWDSFWWPYIKEHHSELTNEDREPNGYYDIYKCWFPEMEDKLDELLEKYDLKPHKNEKTFDDINELCEAEGISGLFYDNAGTMSGDGFYGYGYDDGSFQFEGDFTAGIEEPISFQLRRNVYGYFESVMVNVGNTDRYTEWEYNTTENVHVTVAECRDTETDEYGKELHPHAFAIIERPSSLVIVNIFSRDDYWYEKDGIKYTEDSLKEYPEAISFYPNEIRRSYELPSQEELKVFLEDLHAENIP